MHLNPEEILDFWFLPAGTPGHGQPRAAWFRKDPAFDEAIRSRFLPMVQRALAGEYLAWEAEPRHALALLIMLDQFPRNLFRGEAQAFSGDERARSVARKILATGGDNDMQGVERMFVYLPFEHSESLADQLFSVQLFTQLANSQAGFADTLDYAQRHLAVIERFGRFPHRNAALGRASTEAETAYLNQPGSGF